jgi:UDP-glucose 4-epimerase
MTILVTGGCGYIGAHTIVDLLQNGFDVISIDNFSRSNDALLKGIERITGKVVLNYAIDLCDADGVESIFKKHQFDGIIHFAAYKSVAESVQEPLLYFQNNNTSLINILHCAEKYNVTNFVFSSSCSVYGDATELPVTEQTQVLQAQSAYALTKQMGEQMMTHVAKKTTNHIRFSILRYFNPTGAHPSNEIGEITIGKPSYLIPSITQTAIGKIEKMTVFGIDYDTRDGSCIRDFVHVCDIASAHTLALQIAAKANQDWFEIINLGSGNGVTVLEAIHSFEKINQLKLNYTLGERRAGDVIAVYANCQKAIDILGWHCKYSLDDMMRTAWAWEKKMNKSI